jgi:hypothetical protein
LSLVLLRVAFEEVLKAKGRGSVSVLLIIVRKGGMNGP